MSASRLKRSALGLAFAIGLTFTDWQNVQAQAEPPTPGHAQELYFDAARAGRVDLLQGLIKAGIDPDARDLHGYTALILAAYNGQLQAVDVLIAKGADPCATDPGGNSALMGVAFRGENKVVERLLAERCDINATNNAGQTALMMAA